MPNWCCTSYAIYGGSESEIEDVRTFISDAIKAPNKNCMGLVGASEDWTGKVLLKAGLDPDDIYCRGFIQDVSDVEETGDGNYFYVRIDSEDAWSPIPDVYEALLNTERFSKYKDLGFVYIAEEPGNDLYVNTDTEANIFTDKWLVEFRKDGNCQDSDYYAEDEEKLLLERINDHTKKKFETLKEAYEYSCTEDGSDVLSLHEFLSD